MMTATTTTQSAAAWSTGMISFHWRRLYPAPGGKIGQIITMWHDAQEREVIAVNFTEWLERFAQDLETGEQVYSDDYGGIVSVDDL